MARGSGSRRSRPCSICGKWFYPDPRLGKRQATCGAEKCRRERKRRQQAAWSARNPGYWRELRLRASLAKASKRSEAGAGGGGLRGPPREVERIPADILDEVAGPELSWLLGLVAKIVYQAAQAEMRAQLPALQGKVPTMLPGRPQVVMGGQHAVTKGDAAKYLEVGAQAETDAVSRSP